MYCHQCHVIYDAAQTPVHLWPAIAAQQAATVGKQQKRLLELSADVIRQI